MGAVLAEHGAAYPAVVVEDAGRVVAFAWTSSYRSRPCYDGIGEFSVYVERSSRGTGAGRLALAELAAECERRGFWKLVSRIFPENTASRRLCASLGFREVGVYRRHGQLDGRWRDCVIVELLLGEARPGGSRARPPEEDATRAPGDAPVRAPGDAPVAPMDGRPA